MARELTYGDMARRAETLASLALDANTQSYWKGFRRGMVDSRGPQDNETMHDIFSWDLTRAMQARGYEDGLRWNGDQREWHGSEIKLSPEAWLRHYGEHYGVTSLEYVRQMCREQAVNNYRSTVKLPPPWRAQKHGRSWLITA